MDAHDPDVGEHARPTVNRVSRASIESWPLRWKVAATLVLPIMLAATFGDHPYARTQQTEASILGVTPAALRQAR